MNHRAGMEDVEKIRAMVCKPTNTNMAMVRIFSVTYFSGKFNAERIHSDISLITYS